MSDIYNDVTLSLTKMSNGRLPWNCHSLLTALVTQKDITIKEHIFYAIQYFKENELPLAKTVVLK